MPQLSEDFDALKGAVLLVDKPKGWTSFDVVNKIRYALGRKAKVGHAGTLDPLATGLLVVCCGAMTKQVDKFQAQHKTYEGKLVFGATTESYDAETPAQDFKDISQFSLQEAKLALQHFKGKISQTPPLYSAVQINGKRAYQLAREGKPIDLKAREVEVFELEILDFNLPEATFKMVCSKGTYVRSFVHDLGQKLGYGAYLSELRRTQSGEFDISLAWQIDELVAAIKLFKSTKP